MTLREKLKRQADILDAQMSKWPKWKHEAAVFNTCTPSDSSTQKSTNGKKTETLK